MPKLDYAETIESLADLLAFIGEHVSEFDDILFRGQTQDWELLPKLARLRFRGDVSIAEAEAKMLSTMQSRSIPFLDHPPTSTWDWLSIAQHNGMATRLLDWTTNPLIALWFAVEKPANGDEDGVVWIFTPDGKDHVPDAERADPFKSDRTRVYRPKHINRRIVAQNGWFTVHYLSSKGRFIPFEKISRYKNSLMKLRIPAKSFPDLRFELDRCGINTATVYSDLVGVCRDSEWQHSLLDDEDSD